MAGLFRRLFGHFGHSHRKNESTKKAAEKVKQKVPSFTAVKKEVPVQPQKAAAPIVRQVSYGPVVSRCSYGKGGVQGLKWYAERLRVDDDGDVAEEFLREVWPGSPGNRRWLPHFEAVRQTRPVKLRGPVCTHDGDVRQFIEPSGRNLWV